MKKYVLFAACCLLFAGFSSCSEEDNDGTGKTADSAPTVDESLGIKYPVTTIGESGWTLANFNYQNGKMVNGITDESSYFLIKENPLLINISYEGDYDEENINYTNIKTNSSGFITDLQYKIKGTYDEDTYVINGSIKSYYTSDGYISKQVIAEKDEEADYLYTASFLWDNGDLKRIAVNYEATEGGYYDYENDVYELKYDRDKSENLNSGIYLYNLYEDDFTYDFMWYAGLFGKTTQHIPVSIAHKRSYQSNDDSSESEENIDVYVSYNSDASISSIEYFYEEDSYSDVYNFGYSGENNLQVPDQRVVSNSQVKKIRRPSLRHVRFSGLKNI